MPEYLAPGVYVEEVSFRSKSIEGVGTSTTAFVGPTRRGPLSGVPEVITSFGEFTRVYGGVTNLTLGGVDTPNYLAHAVRAFFDNGGSRLYVARTYQPSGGNGRAQSTPFFTNGNNSAHIEARQPGSGLEGQVRFLEKRTPASPRTMETAPAGTLLLVPAQAQTASLTGGAPTFTLQNDAALTLTLAGGDSTITFTATPAVVTGTAVLGGPIDIPADTTLDVTVGGAAQSIALPDGNTPPAALLAAINAELTGATATIDADQLVITSDAVGTAASVAVTANPLLGFAADDSAAGGGNVADVTAVTIAEINQLLQTASVPVTAAANTDGNLTLTTTATGTTATIAAADTPARTALGLPDTTATGVTPILYQKIGSGWQDASASALNLQQDPFPTAAFVGVNVEASDGDGNTILYEDLGFAATHPRYIGEVLKETPNSRSDALQNAYFLNISGTVTPFDLHAGLLGGLAANTIAVANGSDGAQPVNNDNDSVAISYNDALLLLEQIDDIAIIAAPGYSTMSEYEAIQQSLISHAERMRYRIAVLDTPPDQSLGEARTARSVIDSKYAALYYPWVTVANPLARPGNSLIPKEINLPPSGFITGIYARNDVERGVWKAPANEVVRGAIRFEREINKGQQQVLNPEGINCLRFFPGRGFRVWGARTISSDPEWKYVNVRRYFIYLEHSIDRSTQWAVFEPNGPALWANIRETVTGFLYNEWRSGALLGANEEEAFFVRCDRSTMTQNDLDNGRLICEIGVAIVYPAEFVIFRIGQKTADARS